MKIAAIGNPNVLLGLGIAGVETIFESNIPEDALSFIDTLIGAGEYGLVIITSDLYQQLKPELDQRREKHRLPLFVEFKSPGLQ